MKRQYKFNPLQLNIGPKTFFELAKREYRKRFPSEDISPDSPFAYCIMNLVINPNKTMRIEYRFPQDVPLPMKFIHKRPGGLKPGEVIRIKDSREVTEIIIPAYEGRYYFDFVFWVLDLTTNAYWMTHLWTCKVCPDLRYYLSKERKNQYKEIGLSMAKKYTRTFILGHVKLRTGKFRSSKGIKKLVKYGWIPTIALLPQPYGEMVRIIESTDDIKKINSYAVSEFNEYLLNDILSRWKEASLVQKRMTILANALEQYKKDDFISTVYILLPQIEGLINDHIKRKHQLPE